MADVLEIVQGISQVMANTHDGAVDGDGEPIKIGLKREEDVAITDKRVMDGFKVAMSGDTLFIKYHGEVTMKEAKASGFESEMEQMIADISSFLKKEYKKVTGSALTLKKLLVSLQLIMLMTQLKNGLNLEEKAKPLTTKGRTDNEDFKRKISNDY